MWPYNFSNSHILALGLILLAQFVTIMVGIIMGGFRFGFLKKTIEFKVEKDVLDDFLEIFEARRLELGFQDQMSEYEFIQSGQVIADFSSFTHAKSKKMLKMEIGELAPDCYRIEMTLKYLNLILADTGESAYLDAVLGYLSNKENEMKVVPNLSNAGACCFFSGIIACILVGITIVNPSLLWEKALAIFSLASLGIGIIAIITILCNRKELRGMAISIIGTVINALVVLLYMKYIGIGRFLPFRSDPVLDYLKSLF